MVVMRLPQRWSSSRSLGRLRVDHRHPGTHADGDLQRVAADHAGAQDHQPGRWHARHAGQQQASAAVRLLEQAGGDLDDMRPATSGSSAPAAAVRRRGGHGLVVAMQVAPDASSASVWARSGARCR